MLVFPAKTASCLRKLSTAQIRARLQKIRPCVCPYLVGRRQSAAFKSGRGSELVSRREALLGLLLVTEVYS